jgi:hypothetical protein
VNHYQLVSARLESLGIVPPGFGLVPAVFSLLGAGIAEVSTKRSRTVGGDPDENCFTMLRTGGIGFMISAVFEPKRRFRLK